MLTHARSSILGLARTARAGAFAKAFSTSSGQRDVARMQLLGRLTADPAVKTTKGGKDYVLYTVATTDPSGPPNEQGEYRNPTSSFHRIFAFGDSAVQKLQKIPKGTQVLVDANFRIERVPTGEEEGSTRESYLVQHRDIQVISRPKTESISA